MSAHLVSRLVEPVELGAGLLRKHRLFFTEVGAEECFMPAADEVTFLLEADAFVIEDYTIERHS